MKRLLFACVCLGLVATAACGTTEGADLEKIPVGSEVALTRQDGGVVQGRLTERDASTVKVAVGSTVRTVPVTDVAVAQVVDDTTPVALPAAAKFREYTVPAGTTLSVTLTTGADSRTAKVGQEVSGTLTEGLTVDGVTVVPAGSVVSGVVTAAEPSGKVKGRASLSLTFRTLQVEGHDGAYTIDADKSFVANATKTDDAAKIAVPTVGGAVIGGIIGGKKGAVIGGVVGGGAGTAVVLTTTGDEVTLSPGTTLKTDLTAPVEIKVPIKGA